MGRSGIKWVDALFNGSVRALYDLAAVFGVTYEEINVWLFVIAWPGGHALALYTGKQ